MPAKRSRNPKDTMLEKLLRSTRAQVYINVDDNRYHLVDNGGMNSIAIWKNGLLVDAKPSFREAIEFILKQAGT